MEFVGMVGQTVAGMVRDARRSPRLMIGDSPFKGAVKSPAEVVAAWPELANADREVFGIIVLNTRHFATRRIVVSIGTLNASLVHPREVYRAAILYSAASIVAVHNHPSGDVQPSEEDLQITQRLTKAGELLGIALLDHVIISKRGHYSMRAEGDL